MTRLRRILISGYHGFSNIGDEAVLSALVSGLREECADEILITALSASPRETESSHDVRAVHRVSPSQVAQAIRSCDLLISGGGSLIQDATSFLSLIYYLGIIALGRFYRRRVILLGQGIGPLRRSASRILAKRVLDRADVITVRDAASAELLAQLGVRRPRIEVTADPTFLLRPCPREEAVRILSAAGVEDGGDILAVALREWPEAPKVETATAEALSTLSETLPARLLLVPMQIPSDVRLAERIRPAAGERVAVLPAACSPEQMLGVLGMCRLVVGMRLHALIFAASVGVPALGITYDPKVASFLESSGQESISLEETASGLLAERTVGAWSRREALADRLAESVPGMREGAKRNIGLALELLDR